MEYDLGFTKGDNWFRLRAAAIIIEDGCVLLASNDKEDFFYSVGGGVHMNETIEEAVIREVIEETGVRYEIDRLAVIHENFWTGHGVYDKGLHCHELAFYFMMKPRGTKELFTDSHTRFDDKEYVHWIPIEELDGTKKYPTFLKDYLSREHTGIEHIITYEK